MNVTTARRRLVRLLQGAYSGELAAALAYNGHWRSVRDPEERSRIQEIEAEELLHRAEVGRMLDELGAGPSPLRELFFAGLGRVIWLACFVTGWLAPMWGAGRLERGNVYEYVTAAEYAAAADLPHLCDGLLEMAEVEHDHEAYFRGRVLAHRLASWVPLWAPLPPRERIREDFYADHPGLLPGAPR